MEYAIVNGQEIPFTAGEQYLFDCMVDIFINPAISLENRIIYLERYRGMTIINDDTIDRFQETLRQDDVDQEVINGEEIMITVELLDDGSQ